MKKNQKNILMGTAAVAAIALVIYAFSSKKKANPGNVTVMIGTTDQGTPITTQMPAEQAAVLTEPAASISAIQGNSNDVFADASAIPPRLVVGAYNETQGGTWVYPAGDTGSGTFIAGKVQAPEGVSFRASGVFAKCCIGNECTPCSSHPQCGEKATLKTCQES